MTSRGKGACTLHNCEAASVTGICAWKLSLGAAAILMKTSIGNNSKAQKTTSLSFSQSHDLDVRV